MSKSCLLSYSENDENKELEELVYETDYVDMIHNDDEDYTLSNMKFDMRVERRIVGKGKDAKMKFALLFEMCCDKWENFSWGDQKIFSDLKTLKENFDWNKDEIELKKEAFKKGIIFDGMRYWHKFDYENGKLIFKERVITF